MTFLEMSATLFTPETLSSVRLSELENDFSQNASSLLRSEKLIELCD